MLVTRRRASVPIAIALALLAAVVHTSGAPSRSAPFIGPGGPGPTGSRPAWNASDRNESDMQALPPHPRVNSATTAGDLQPGSVNRTSINLRATYDVNVTLNYTSRYLGVSSRMTVVNTSGGPIDRLELNTIAARLGGLRIRAATVDGRGVHVAIDDQTLMVPLGGVLPDGGAVNVALRMSSSLRSTLTGSNWMYTRANGIIDAYRWLPWVSRRLPFNRPNHGDPFMTPVSPQVAVRITTDRPMTIAATGDRVSRSGLTQTFVARNVRDFTITASPFYRTGSVTLGSKTVRVYYRAGAPGSAMLSAARRALSRYGSLLASVYPYRTFKVAQSAGRYGMESPQLIWIPTGVPSANLTYLVFHETAHQWFYGLVGNNQAREPYADEAAADFIARYALGMRRGSRCSTARLDLSIYRYSSTCYYEVIYIQGGNFLDDLRRRMGSTAFWRGLRAYVAAHRYEITHTRTLLDTLDASTSLNLRPRFATRFPSLY
jgi:hypothetical protein